MPELAKVAKNSEQFQTKPDWTKCTYLGVSNTEYAELMGLVEKLPAIRDRMARRKWGFIFQQDAGELTGNIYDQNTVRNE